jgi:hypothetical protein
VVVIVQLGAPEPGCADFEDAGVAASCAPDQRDTFIECHDGLFGAHETVVEDAAVTVPTHTAS